MRTYSSEAELMAFASSSTHVETDILLLDEAVAGRARFFKKANRRRRRKLESLRRDQSSRGDLLEQSAAEISCNKGFSWNMLIKAFGPIEDVINTYAASTGTDTRERHHS